MTWNPVETKPHKGTYWVTIEKHNKTRFVCEAGFTIDYSYSTELEWIITSYDGTTQHAEEYGKVLAWMPMWVPEPFSG
jgi:hypothetical protein